MSIRTLAFLALFQGLAASDSSSAIWVVLAIIIAVVVLAVVIARSAAKEPAKPKRPTVLVCGATGVGKSTLINTLLGAEVAKTGLGEPVTQNTLRVETEGSEFVFYDSKGLEVEDAAQTYLLLMSDLLRLRFGPNPREQIDLVLMCIQEPQGRIDDAHMEIAGLCQDLRIPLGIALTKTEQNLDLEKFARQTIKSADFVRRIRSLAVNLPKITIPAEGIIELKADIRASFERNFTASNHRAMRGRSAQTLASSARKLAAGTTSDSAWIGFAREAWASLGMQGDKWEKVLHTQREHAKRQIVPGLLRRKLNTRFDEQKIDAAIARRLLPVLMRRFADESGKLQASDLTQVMTEAIASFGDNRPYRSRF